jgi:uncharacterized membrane protein YfcA
MEAFTTEIILILVLVAGIAGMVDAIAGGGGLLVLPVLLWVGIPPLQALGTNKLQGSFGTFTSSMAFLYRGHIRFSEVKLAFFASLGGSAAGTIAVKFLSIEILQLVIPGLLIGFALYFLFSPGIGENSRQPRISLLLFSLFFATSIGFYDGFFGPGTGSFLVAAFALLLGYNLTKATAATKLLNFASNIASLAVFSFSGLVIWKIGILMGVAQVIGAWVGSHLAMRHGARVIRPLLVIITVSISLHLIFGN